MWSCNLRIKIDCSCDNVHETVKSSFTSFLFIITKFQWQRPKSKQVNKQLCHQTASYAASDSFPLFIHRLHDSRACINKVTTHRRFQWFIESVKLIKPVGWVPVQSIDCKKITGTISNVFEVNYNVETVWPVINNPICAKLLNWLRWKFSAMSQLVSIVFFW